MGGTRATTWSQHSLMSSSSGGRDMSWRRARVCGMMSNKLDSDNASRSIRQAKTGNCRQLQANAVVASATCINRIIRQLLQRAASIVLKVLLSQLQLVAALCTQDHSKHLHMFLHTVPSTPSDTHHCCIHQQLYTAAAHTTAKLNAACNLLMVPERCLIM